MVLVKSAVVERFQIKHSSIADQLGTNYIPSEVEIYHIRAHIADSEKELSKLNSKIIRRALSARSGLEETRQDLESHLDGLRALVSPARRIPSDIWSLIFVSCVSGKTWPLVNSKVAPMILCQVCSGWRKLAISTPTLWSSLQIRLMMESGLAEDVKISQAVCLWLQRSTVLPLSISFRVSQTQVVGSTTHLWDVLLSHASRWKHLELFLPESHLLLLLLTTPKRFPYLTTLKISVTGPVMHYVDAVTFTFDDAPQLRSVVVGGVSFDIRSLKLNLAQLVALTLRPHWAAYPAKSLTLNDCLDVILQGTGLAELDLTLTVGNSVTRREVMAATLRHLSLGIDPNSAGYAVSNREVMERIGLFFDCLHMPALKGLRIRFEEMGFWPLENVVSFLARSTSLRSLHLCYVSRGSLQDCLRATPNLEELILQDSEASEVEVIEALELVPSLTCLSVTTSVATVFDIVGDDLLRAMTVTNSPTCLLPNLEVIKFELVGKCITDDVIVDMVESRLGGNLAIAQLQRLKLHILRPVSRWLLLQADHWTSRGLDIEVRLESAREV